MLTGRILTFFFHNLIEVRTYRYQCVRAHQIWQYNIAFAIQGFSYSGGKIHELPKQAL